MRVPSQLLRHRMTVTPKGEDHGDGPVPGDPFTVRARVDFRTRLVRDSAGNEVVVSGTAITRDNRIGPEDTVTVGGQDRTVHDVLPIDGPTGRTAGFTVLFR